MTSLTKLEMYTNTLLNIARISDYAPNGVQVRGRQEIGKIITGVSACVDLFTAAIDQQADLILVHHGMFWEKESQVVEGKLKKRLKLLLERDITLMAYHLPLDCHPQLGNNIQILNRLGLEVNQPFGLHRNTHLSFIGRSQEPLSIKTFRQQLQALFGGEPLVLGFGPKQINQIAICSGAAPELIHEAKQYGVDLFLTGEAAEHVYHFAKEEEIHFVAAGHHRTEMIGIQALGDHLAKHFGIQHQFINIENPI